MSLNVGHTIQKLLHNTPIAISTNQTTTSVVTAGGNLYQAGLISNKIQYTFEQVFTNTDIVGHVVDVQSTNCASYLLNDQGVVFVYDYNAGNCTGVIREVYSPVSCGGDPAIKIRAGANHLVILTKKHKVWGVGCNNQYQLVPQGQCSYDIAVELIITDTNIHDNCNCCSFVGTLSELEKPIIPKEKCENISCIKKRLECVKLGCLVINNVSLEDERCPIKLDDLSPRDAQHKTGKLFIPVHGNIEYVGFLCIGNKCDVDGTITYTVCDAHIRKGCIKACFIRNGRRRDVSLTITEELPLENGSFTCATQIGVDACPTKCDDDCCDCCEGESSESGEECCGLLKGCRRRSNDRRCHESSSSSRSCSRSCSRSRSRSPGCKKFSCPRSDSSRSDSDRSDRRSDRRGRCDKPRHPFDCHDDKKSSLNCGDSVKLRIDGDRLKQPCVRWSECGLAISIKRKNGKCHDDDSRSSRSSSSSDSDSRSDDECKKREHKDPCEYKRKTVIVPIGGRKFHLKGNACPHFKLCRKINIDCCTPCNKREEPTLPQPCWTNIFAGFDTTALVDSCNRIYVLGSIHQVRNNGTLLQRSCLEDLLCNTNASISLPASELNCGVTPNNANCACVAPSCKKPFKTDFNKFGVNLQFPQSCGPECEDGCRCHNKPKTVCDFLKALKKCNDAPTCDNTCQPCDSNIYLNVFVCEKDRPLIGTITVLNKKSVCKAVSQCKLDTVNVCINPETVIDFDLNMYCVDGEDFPLTKVLVLHTGARNHKRDHCIDVTVYIDLENPGSIRFTPPCKPIIVEFVADASTKQQQFILNYGGIMDPVELTNLKSLLIRSCTFPCPQFKNPFCTKLFNTYLQGGDTVNFLFRRRDGIKLAVTADTATVFRLNRRILDIGVGDNNLSVLIGGLACPNQIMAIGQNCFGQLGLDSHESTVCFREVNRCLFDCQVQRIFSGETVTLYLTQSGRVFGSGLWKCLVNSTVPVCIPSIQQSWHIKDISISSTHIVFLGREGLLFGLGDNSLGQLGLCNIICVICPQALDFLAACDYKVMKNLLNNRVEEKQCPPLYKGCLPCKVDCGNCCWKDSKTTCCDDPNAHCEKRRDNNNRDGQNNNRDGQNNRNGNRFNSNRQITQRNGGRFF